jgi:hypothetical protein
MSAAVLVNLIWALAAVAVVLGICVTVIIVMLCEK